MVGVDFAPRWFAGPKIVDWSEVNRESGLRSYSFSDAETGFQYRADKRISGGFDLFRTACTPGPVREGQRLCAVPGEPSPEACAIAIHVFGVGRRVGAEEGEQKAKAEIRRALGL